MNAPSDRWGFRCSLLDVGVLVAAAPITWAMRGDYGPVAGVVPFAVGHFFLFCNVFRLRAPLELAWTACALANVGTWMVLEGPLWAPALAVQAPVTLGVIGFALRQPWYHGIAADRLNGRLADYLREREPMGAR